MTRETGMRLPSQVKRETSNNDTAAVPLTTAKIQTCCSSVDHEAFGQCGNAGEKVWRVKLLLANTRRT
jgi:hypothetical protein